MTSVLTNQCSLYKSVAICLADAIEHQSTFMKARGVSLHTRQRFTPAALTAIVLTSVGALIGVGCAEVTGIPNRAMAMQPLPQYAAWWRLTEECEGRTIDTDAIRWYSYPGANLPVVSGGDSAQGEWLPDENAIIVAEEFLRNGQLVRHEMLHALRGSTNHPRDDFRVKCGGIVACEGPCATDGGVDPLPSAGAEAVDLKRLVVSGRVFPADIAVAEEGGWHTIIVSVTNPGPAGWVHLQRIPGTDAYSTYGYVRAAGSDEAYDYTYVDSMPFLSGETKRFSIDPPSPAVILSSPVQTIRPFFNIDTGAAVAYSVHQ